MTKKIMEKKIEIMEQEIDLLKMQVKQLIASKAIEDFFDDRIYNMTGLIVDED